MPSSPRLLTIRYASIPATAASLLLVLAACTAPAGAPESSSSAATGYPSAHVHGIAVDEATGKIMVATHEGLFDVTARPAVKISPTIDLMGFSPTEDPDVFYASGHPGKGSTLPNPVGLIRSGDGGKTWEELSRQGESDFHAMTMTKSGVVAFDGILRTSPDGKTWNTSSAGFQAAVLAGNPGSDTVLATTQQGLQRSTDGGKTWQLLGSGPLVQFAAFATNTDAIGIEPSGAVHYSADGGATWAPKGSLNGEIQAVTTAKAADGQLNIWAATGDGVLVSKDSGASFTPYDPS
ncbi:F510_1955 family glycosylhydrolase [Pseudarthrobacter raffinosi]|uniref:F510_1955 family glycosylhydrolase n=1 Tax=Pseudarthrobacter raffinosi TaxID=2953651 RepID=UPI00208EFD06|nr:exo-alpha-sialidase [Pseudarthrobacter sp. MDT3-28]MCO4239200.1 exo-alpha-sialidase [Pseudarthrobacter sp. MDT3-28]